MTNSLKKLMEIAGRVEMTPSQREQQRRSFAYGSANIENERVTRQMVDAAAEKLKSTKKGSDG
jgi:hypothetical protein